FRAICADVVRSANVLDPRQGFGKRHITAPDIEQQRKRAHPRYHGDTTPHLGKIIRQITEIRKRIIVAINHECVEILPRHFITDGIETRLELSLRHFLGIPSRAASLQNRMSSKDHFPSSLTPTCPAA